METFEEILKANTRYIEIISNQYGQDQDTVKDLEQVGRIGLWTAYQRYDPTKEIPFIKYAVWYIKKEMTKFLAENGRTIRIPNNLVYDKNFVPTTLTTSLNTPINEDGGTLHDVIGSEVSEEENDYSSLKTALMSLKEKERILIEMYYGINTDNPPMNYREIGEALGTSRQNIEEKIKKALLKLKQNENIKTNH
jgi:RNA polymerase sigma factor (sigma-70 family)